MGKSVEECRVLETCSQVLAATRHYANMPHDSPYRPKWQKSCSCPNCIEEPLMLKTASGKLVDKACRRSVWEAIACEPDWMLSFVTTALLWMPQQISLALTVSSMNSCNWTSHCCTLHWSATVHCRLSFLVALGGARSTHGFGTARSNQNDGRRQQHRGSR